MERSALRRDLEHWFSVHGIHPRVVGEFQDNALLNVFGNSGAGIFAAPSAIEDEVKRYVRVVAIGKLSSIREEFYAVSAERKIKHPAVATITESARSELFST
jgi:LysR family transcriptional activator of nhaA